IGLNFGGPSGFPQGRNDTLGVLSDTATLLRGRHTLKIGGEARRYLVANFGLSIGNITFSSTANNFMQDNATVFGVTPTSISSRNFDNAIGLFVQDNFKMTPNLVLELVGRFEWNGTPVEGANRYIVFNKTAVTLTQVGTNGLSRTAAYAQNYNVEPR